MINEGTLAGRVLIIDNNEDNLAVLSRILRREGYHVTISSNGLNGLEQIHLSKPDLVLADITATGLNGFQLTQRLKADPNISYIPIILITTHIADKIQGLEAGADDILIKPVQHLEIIARARSLIRLKKSTDALLAAAEEKAQLYLETERRAHELSTLHETALAVGSQLTLTELLNLITAKSCQLVKARAAFLYLCYEDQQNLTVLAEYNSPPHISYIGRTLDYGEGAAGLVALTNKPIRINNYTEWSGRAKAFEDDGNITALLCIPLYTGGRVVGVLVVTDDYKTRTFTDDDVRLLNLLAPQAAIAISNALLYEQVMQERDRIEAVLNSVTDGILMLDSNYKVVLCNPRFSELMLLEQEQVLDQSIGVVANMLGDAFESEPHFSAELVSHIMRDFRRKPQDYVQHKITIDDPKRRYVDWAIIPVRDQAGTTVGWLNVFHDTTQQRELEQLRDDFISMLVHDLRSPLTSIIGGIELVSSLMDEVAPDENIERQHEFMEQVSRNCYNLLELINALLEVSRLEAGRMPLHLETTNLEELITGSISQIIITAKDKQVSINVDLPVQPIHIRVDSEKMRRVIVNLLSNAIRYSTSGTEIDIVAQVEEVIRRRGTTTALDPSVLRRGSTAFLRDQSRVAEASGGQLKALLLSIRDQGPGIPAASLERIFEKFTQLPQVSKNRSGTGLGLALCKLVVETHGGRIWAESEPGQGSTFYFSIPCVLDSGDL
ncbi:MAG: hypothetical protein JWP00_1994 [Chloroflexi bacterium]|jgi:PAS domain S-box-containing protein|nr:hypothetical protein [Chloroflexota bacterium]